jgi:hypothetical protein
VAPDLDVIEQIPNQRTATAAIDVHSRSSRRLLGAAEREAFLRLTHAVPFDMSYVFYTG